MHKKTERECNQHFPRVEHCRHCGEHSTEWDLNSNNGEWDEQRSFFSTYSFLFFLHSSFLLFPLNTFSKTDFYYANIQFRVADLKVSLPQNMFFNYLFSTKKSLWKQTLEGTSASDLTLPTFGTAISFPSSSPTLMASRREKRQVWTSLSLASNLALQARCLE